MDDLVNIKKTMTSKEIAELTGKNHNHLMRDIRIMAPMWEKVNGTSFVLSTYTDAKGEKRPQYLLDSEQAKYCINKFLQKKKMPDILYVIQVNEYVKIGVTRNLELRMQTIQTASPYEINLCYQASLNKACYVEKKLHNIFKNNRIRGEWFKVHPSKVIEAIETLK
jgi:phage regulator Rha-like protein